MSEAFTTKLKAHPNHKTGPWEVHVGGYNLKDDLSVWSVGGDGEDRVACWINSAENARLIAAAPDLLAACKAAHHGLDLLFARLILLDCNFLPTKSGDAWDAMLLCHAAITQIAEVGQEARGTFNQSEKLSD